MAKNKAQKKVILEHLEKKIGESKSIVFAQFNGLAVKENEDLRNKLREEGGEYYVPKKTLLDIALKNNDISVVEAKEYDGKVAVIFGYKDEVMSAKVLDKFIGENEGKIDFLGGILEGNYLNAEEVKKLAKIPSKEELYVKMVGSLNSPVSGFVNVLAGNLRGLMNVLKAIEEKKA